MKRVAYVMSRFPKVTETFVLYEMLELERLGHSVEVFPLMRERTAVVHPEARDFVDRARHQPPVSPAVVVACAQALARRPVAYLGAMGRSLAATFASPRQFGGAVAFFGKAVWMAREMERLGIEHVHAHFATHPALAALVIHRLTGIPFSFTAHGSDIHVDQVALDVKITEAAFAVTVSEYNKRFLVERVGGWIEPRLQVIHCGIDPEAFAMRDEDAADDGILSIACIASLRGVKGHRHLIDACRMLRDRGVAFRCDLVGDGPQRGAIEDQIAAAGLQDRVILHGSLARPKVIELLRAADVAALTSIQDARGRREGIPVSLMEAMACGLPVVSSMQSGIPELVADGESGLLVPPGDARAIAGALEHLAATPHERRRMGRAGREAVVRGFSLRAAAERLGALIDEAGRELSAVGCHLSTMQRREPAGIAYRS